MGPEHEEENKDSCKTDSVTNSDYGAQVNDKGSHT